MMSILKCIECGHGVSEYADKCPECGCPMHIIKMQKSVNSHLIKFRGGDKIDLTGIEDLISEEDLKNSNRVWRVLEEHFGARISICSTVNRIFEFNNYKFPDDYQQVYDDMCAHNASRRENRPKCPTCGSMNVRRISTTKRAGSILGLGLVSSSIGKTYECLKCKYKW